MRAMLIFGVLLMGMAAACSESAEVESSPDASVKPDRTLPAEASIKVDQTGPMVDGPRRDTSRADGPGNDVRLADLTLQDSWPQDTAVAPDTVDEVCSSNIPETIYPGAPFVYVRPVASPTMHLTDFHALREVSGGFLEAFLTVEKCARLSAPDLVAENHRVMFDQTGEPTVVGPWQTYELVDNQGAGLYAWDKDTRTAALFDTQTAAAPSWTRMLVGQSEQVSPIGSGGFMATLWNGSHAADYTWDSLTIMAYEKNGYLVRASGSGQILWHRKVDNDSATVLAVEDGGTSLVQTPTSYSSQLAWV